MGSEGARDRPFDDWIREMSASPEALSTDRANAQHYEMPPAVFELAPRRDR